MRYLGIAAFSIITVIIAKALSRVDSLLAGIVWTLSIALFAISLLCTITEFVSMCRAYGCGKRDVAALISCITCVVMVTIFLML